LELWETGEGFSFVRLCTLVEIPADEDENDGDVKDPFPYKFIPDPAE
jgi:hypothetical protein